MSAKSLDKYVLDTSALMTFIEKEEGLETVRDLLEKASDKENRIFISTVSAIEVFYISMREQSRAVAEERLELLETLPLIPEPPDAGSLKNNR